MQALPAGVPTHVPLLQAVPMTQFEAPLVGSTVHADPIRAAVTHVPLLHTS